MSSSAIQPIQQRYSELASQTCCLSCGGALDLAKAQPGEVGIDLGSGRGQDVLRMAEQVGPEGQAFGVDVTPAMIEQAKRNAHKLGVDNAHFVTCALDKIDLPDQIADLIISNCTLNHSADKDAVWGQVFRLLKPGGRFVISDITATQPVPAAYADDPVAVAECWAGAVTRDVYLQQVQRAGLVDVQILEESPPYPKGKIDVVSITLSGRRPA